MPWMIDITAMSVVVARMSLRSVRKLRSLLARRESAATEAASRNEAVWEGFFIRRSLSIERTRLELCSVVLSSSPAGRHPAKIAAESLTGSQGGRRVQPRAAANADWNERPDDRRF